MFVTLRQYLMRGKETNPLRIGKCKSSCYGVHFEGFHISNSSVLAILANFQDQSRRRVEEVTR